MAQTIPNAYRMNTKRYRKHLTRIYFFCFICIGFINLEFWMCKSGRGNCLHIATYTNETIAQLKTESFRRMRHFKHCTEHIHLLTHDSCLIKQNHFQFWLIVSLTQCKIIHMHTQLLLPLLFVDDVANCSRYIVWKLNGIRRWCVHGCIQLWHALSLTSFSPFALFHSVSYFVILFAM